ncbi:MAG: GNAT family N-acetyltransferase [Chthonomonadaceae bacterium]|nr:GNAT family N-acetyltransferase [Chthonomonadaceae bacterium]
MSNFWQGEKIRLRGVEGEDAATFHRWNLDSERGRWLDFIWPPVSLAHVEEWLKKTTLQALEEDSFHWLIENQEGIPVGSINTHHCNRRAGTFFYGIDIEEAHRRNGYAREAIEMVLRYYFGELRYQKANVHINAENLASIALHERVGFTLEGTLRSMSFSDNRFSDLLWFGMTLEEWKQKGLSRHENGSGCGA